VGNTFLIGDTNGNDWHFNIVLVSGKSNASDTFLKCMGVAVIKNISLRKNDKGLTLFKLLHYMTNKVELRVGRKSTNTTQEKPLQAFEFIR